MRCSQLTDILKFRLGANILPAESDDTNYISLLSIDKAIFRRKLPSGKYSYFILNSKVLDFIRAHNFPPLHKNTIAYNYLVSRIYGPSLPLPELLSGFTLAGLDIAIDVNIQDLAPKLGFSFELFQRLLVGAYSSSSKRIIMSLDSFTRYLLKNNPINKGSQTAFYELYSVQDNKFLPQVEVSAASLLLEAYKTGFTAGIPTDFFFGKDKLKRARVSSSFFSFDLDIYDKGAKEASVEPYKNVTRFELRFRGCDRGALRPEFMFNSGEGSNRCSLVEENFLRFLDKGLLLRQRPNKRISKTSFSNLYKWSEDSWWSKVKSRLFDGRVFHLDAPKG